MSAFTNHVIVKAVYANAQGGMVTSYFDPSYGAKYLNTTQAAAEAAMDALAIDAYYTVKNKLFTFTKNDPNATELRFIDHK